ncbi:M20 family metallopeptidase [Candidatus Pantoea floridensis]|uniref:Acetylornithine deacetylase/Succinyl-diaminopimelate desuccinylase n=1 Tax=Candidatus Pantoea floridensis TaxID=1938870 RepID=A0A286BZB1_9GAMM|nr:M20/M25/M40 family metallo-hydrolase [Pantoea floridensis]PIF21973.1 acetylornithine deacetylase/succinyl-diaminopimelate desuccinylase-like protein [Enterobacteriaceae bacterium JKS000233]SOD39483.1 Acetylornithine deacetylase/Succinyl-diaminopimelate desuccinylase [Pantoea floridensis]
MSRLAATLELLSELTRWPSVAGQLSAQRGLAAWLERWMVEQLNAAVIHPVATQHDEAPPLVHVRIDNGSDRSVVLYNMYDVMPADDAGWDVAPFIGGIVEWPELGQVFVGRGAENNKGPVAALLILLREMQHSQQLNFNIEILLEGEEEVGSGALRRYLAQQPCPIAPAEAVLFPSLCEYGGGAPRVYLGFTGLASGRLNVTGGDWGGPSSAIHASNAGWIANPAWRLVQALHAIAPAEHSGVLARSMPDDEANQLLASLAEQFSIHDELRFRRSQRLMIAGDTLSSLQTLLGSAVLTLAELHSDPPGGRGVIPFRASAELAFRIPPGFDQDAMIAAAQQRLAQPDLAGCELQLFDRYPGVRFSRHAPGVDALIASYQTLGAAPQIWPWAPGCAPAYAFAAVAPAFLIGGLGHGGNAHAVNEFVTLAGLERFQQSMSLWLTAFNDSAIGRVAPHQGNTAVHKNTRL